MSTPQYPRSHEPTDPDEERPSPEELRELRRAFRAGQMAEAAKMLDPFARQFFRHMSRTEDWFELVREMEAIASPDPVQRDAGLEKPRCVHDFEDRTEYVNPENGTAFEPIMRTLVCKNCHAAKGEPLEASEAVA